MHADGEQMRRRPKGRHSTVVGDGLSKVWCAGEWHQTAQTHTEVDVYAQRQIARHQRVNFCEATIPGGGCCASQCLLR